MPLTPLDYRKLLVPHDPGNAYPQPEADFWRKVKMDERKKPVLRGSGKPVWVTPPIIRHAAVQKLARMFGVKIEKTHWHHREVGAEGLLLTCEVTVSGYEPVGDELASKIVGKKVELSKDYVVPGSTTAIGEVNATNAGSTGRNYPQCRAEKRGYDRAVLEHLGLFHCYGDSEEPRFAQDADYEAKGAEDVAGTACRAPTGAPVARVTNKEWAALPKDVCGLAHELMNAPYNVGRPKLDLLYRDCDGEAGPLKSALLGMKEKLDGTSQD